MVFNSRSFHSFRGQGGGMGRGSGAGRGGGGGRGRGGGGGRRGKSPGLSSGGNCICPSCGTKIPHKPGVPCFEEKCPNCGTQMIRE